MYLYGINIWAVLVAAVASFVLGGIWYNKAVFGKTWMKLSGTKPKKGSNTKMVYGFLTTVVMAYVLALFIGAGSGAIRGMAIAFWVWLGFIATITLSGWLWENRAFKLWALNNIYNIISLLVMGAIIGAW
ncbi:DUF1761 domain-containing protein [Candidatus Woesearchaeota archaeon]|nr:DUF1761 domain-containing protein [Candidatus Woesearchaeota archaeon]